MPVDVDASQSLQPPPSADAQQPLEAQDDHPHEQAAPHEVNGRFHFNFTFDSKRPIVIVPHRQGKEELAQRAEERLSDMSDFW